MLFKNWHHCYCSTLSVEPANAYFSVEP